MIYVNKVAGEKCNKISYSVKGPIVYYVLVGGGGFLKNRVYKNFTPQKNLSNKSFTPHCNDSLKILPPPPPTPPPMVGLVVELLRRSWVLFLERPGNLPGPFFADYRTITDMVLRQCFHRIIRF